MTPKVSCAAGSLIYLALTILLIGLLSVMVTGGCHERQLTRRPPQLQLIASGLTLQTYIRHTVQQFVTMVSPSAALVLY